MLRHYLQPLLAPRSVALVGATERPGALGEILHRNLAAAHPGGALYALNPKHATLFGAKAYARLADLPAKPDLAVIVTPARSVPGIVRDAGAAGIRAAAVLTSGFAEAGEDGKSLQSDMLRAAREAGVRLLGPNCLGVIRTDVGLNATFARSYAHAGNLALVSQSGAMCTAMLDWAWTAGVGFTSVVSLGGAADIDFGEVLDFLVADEATRAILMYVEGVRDARRFVSALRAAARAKPVIALKVGRYRRGSRAATSHTGALAGSDAVFEAALRRSGTVRVKTYTQLFAAARLLAGGATPRREGLAIVTHRGAPAGGRGHPARRAPGDRHHRRRPWRGGGGQRRRERRAARRARAADARGARRRAAGAMVARQSARHHRRCAAGALRRGDQGGTRRSRRRRAARALFAGRRHLAAAGRRGRGARRARPQQAGAGRLARRHQSERDATQPGRGRHPELLYAGERRRGLLLRLRLPAPPA